MQTTTINRQESPNRRNILAASLLLAMFAAGCGGGSSASNAGAGADADAAPAGSSAGGSAITNLSGRLVLTGSSTVAPLAAEIGKRFESLHPQVRVDVQTGGSERGIADARSGLADIGMVSRALFVGEEDLTAFIIGRDGICMIVHADNPIPSLTPDQIVSIYTGGIVNWSQVGGRDAPITVVNKAEGRSTLELFEKHFNLSSSDIQADVVIGDNQQGIKTVAGNPDAIGYVSIGAAAYEAASAASIRLLPLQGVQATVANVANGSFPLGRELNLVTSAPPQGLVLAFIEFAQSPQVHDLVRRLYFAPVTP